MKNFSKTKIIGVLNITPDSFSDGGLFLTPKNALNRAEEMLKQGADIIDIGAESTAPHNTNISEEKEWARLKETLPTLLEKKIPLSLDSQKANIWEKFLHLGGKMINDVSGLGGTTKEVQKKIDLLGQFPDTQIILMYSRDISFPDPHDLLHTIEKDIFSFFQKKIALLEQAGISKSRIILDPGMGGFLSKNPDISFLVLKKIPYFLELGCELYIGTSRKSFLSSVTHNISPHKRVIASVVSSLFALQKGAKYLRVHDVKEMKEAKDTFLQCAQ